MSKVRIALAIGTGLFTITWVAVAIDVVRPSAITLVGYGVGWAIISIAEARRIGGRSALPFAPILIGSGAFWLAVALALAWLAPEVREVW